MGESSLIKRNLCFLLISITLACINFFVFSPINEKYHVFSEGIPMTLTGRIIVFAINAPLLAAYSIYSWKFFEKLKYFNFLNYPLAIVNICALSLATLLSVVGNGTFMWILMLPMLGAIGILIMSIFCGLILDIKAWVEYLKSKKS